MKKRFTTVILTTVLVLSVLTAFATDSIPFTNKSANRANMGIVALAAENEATFSDVSINAWYADAVAYCYENGLMAGTSATTFAPETDLSRAMVVTILHRDAGTPAATSGAGFTDVPSGQWYSDAIAWAVQNDVVSGYGNGLFGTNDPITREQLVTILWRYDGEKTSQNNAAFSDTSSVSSWASTAVAWGSENKIANVKDGNRFEPKSNASRAEAAYMFMQLLSPASDVNPAAGFEPVVYMTTDISPEGLMAVYEALGWTPTGDVAVKISTGEPPNSNYLKPELIKDLVQSVEGTIVECNTAYGGSRANTAMHLQVAKDHGFTEIADVDIQDANGTYSLPVSGGTQLNEHIVGASFPDYDSYIVLSHFKGHQMAGFGGAIKNISIGLGSSEGKSWIHSGGTSRTSTRGDQDSFLRAMGDAGKAVSDYLGDKIIYINVMNRLSVDCDCNGRPAEPDMHDIGILASTDPVALDQACIDLIYAAEDGQSLITRIESRNGLLTLEHAEKIGLGSKTYEIKSIK